MQTTLKLNTGHLMPSVGLGLWKVPNNVCAETVYQAIKSGYRLLDSASDYANEVEVGQGLKRAITDGIVKREDMFIASKLWNTYHRKEHVKAACVKTMKDLQVDYLDLYLIHFPIALKYVPIEERYPAEWLFFNEENPVPCMVEDVGCSYQETYQAMEVLVNEGLVRSIGCSNIGVTMLREVLCYAKIRPAALQIELHPRLSQKKLLRFCKNNNIAVTAFSCLASNSYVELGGAKVEDSLLNNQILMDIGKSCNKTAAQVMLRWGVQRGTAIIPKSVNKERLEQNINLFDFELTEEQMNSVDGLNINMHYNDPGNFCEEAFGLFFPIFE